MLHSFSPDRFSEHVVAERAKITAGEWFQIDGRVIFVALVVRMYVVLRETFRAYRLNVTALICGWNSLAKSNDLKSVCRLVDPQGPHVGIPILTTHGTGRGQVSLNASENVFILQHPLA